MGLDSIGDLSRELDRKIESILEHYDVPGAGIAVVKDGQEFLKPWGEKRLGSGDPVTPHTAFNIASTSKAYTAFAASLLVDDDILSWDDPIQKYVPEFQLYDSWASEHATLRDLSGNRLGLPRDGLTEFGLNVDIPAEYAFEKLQYIQPIAGLRERFTYVNPGHTAVATAVARASGMHFIDFLKQRLFEPLGMNSTSGGVRAQEDLKDDLASWHCNAHGETIRIDAVFADNYLGSGAMCSSAHDAAKWLSLHLNKGSFDGQRIISESAITETHNPQIDIQPEDLAIWIGVPETTLAAYGLGWAMSEQGGYKVVRHSGSDLGVSAQVAFVPDLGIGVSVYVNKNCAAALEVSYTILAELMELPSCDWRSLISDESAPSTQRSVPRLMDVEPSSDIEIRADLPLSAYEGVYFSPANGRLIITQVGDNQLSFDLEFGSIYGCDLYPLGGHAFLPIAKHPSWDANLRVKTEFSIKNGIPDEVYMPELGKFERQYLEPKAKLSVGE